MTRRPPRPTRSDTRVPETTLLRAKLGAGDEAPEKPEDYKLEAPKDAEGKPIEGVDFESFTKDPLFQSFQKAAHAKGMTNEQLQFVTERYIELAPQLFSADKSLSADEAKADRKSTRLNSSH